MLLAALATGFSQPAIIQFTSANYSVSETGAMAVVTVEITWGDPFEIYTVDYSTSNATAVAGADFSPQSGTLAWPETNKSFTIPILDDRLAEGDETILLTLTNPAFDGTLGIQSNAALTILADDGPFSWIERDSGISNSLAAIAYGNGSFVAVGEFGTILTSSDGRVWSPQSSGTTNLLLAVTCANGLWVAVGLCGTILTSSNAVSWVAQDSGTTQNLSGVTFGNGVFVTVAGLWYHPGSLVDAILTSSDGIAWTNQPLGAHNYYGLSDVTFGKDVFVAVGAAGAILTSGNGITWIDRGKPVPLGSLWGITYGNGRFVAVGRGGDQFCYLEAVTSADAVHWDRSQFGSTRTNSGTCAEGIAYGNGFFVAVGLYGIYVSLDGIEWTRARVPPGLHGFQFLGGVAFGNGSFVAVGDPGRILQSDPVLQLGISFDRLPTLAISGPRGAYQIEAASELRPTNAWEAVATISVTNTPHIWTDPHATNAAGRFYRAVLLP